MVRGLLMLSLRPRLILTTDTDWDSDTVSDTPLLDMAMDSDMAMVSSMVRGLLMLSPRPRLILTTDTDWDSDTVSDTPLLDMAMDSDTAMDSSTARGLLMRGRSLLRRLRTRIR